MAEDREDRIRERAYALWEKEGRPEGRHENHWREASQEAGDELFPEQGETDAQDRPGALDGGLLDPAALVAGGGPSGSGVGGLGMAGESDEAAAEERDAALQRRSAGGQTDSGET